MRPITRRLLAAGAILHALTLPALADSLSFPLTGTWQKIASSGSTVQVQASGSTIRLTTSTGIPALAAGQNLPVGQPALTLTLAQDLWALSNAGGIAVVTAGLAGGSSASPYAQATPADHSGSITLGGSAQPLMGINASRHGCDVQNLSTADEWISELGTAAPSQPSRWLPPGAYWSCPVTGVPTGAISIYGAITGQTVTAREW